jgi:hypothetical protein
MNRFSSTSSTFRVHTMPRIKRSPLKTAWKTTEFKIQCGASQLTTLQSMCVMNPAGPSPSGLRFSMEFEVDRASWMVTMVTLATMVTVLLVLGWLLAFR